jgi:hypothetical protein
MMSMICTHRNGDTSIFRSGEQSALLPVQHVQLQAHMHTITRLIWSHVDACLDKASYLFPSRTVTYFHLLAGAHSQGVCDCSTQRSKGTVGPAAAAHTAAC